MSLLAALVLATTTARVEAVTLTTVDSQPAVRVSLSGQPGSVTVAREDGGARISIGDVGLGGRFAGGSHYAWTPARPDPAPRAAPVRVDRIEVVEGPSGVGILLHVPPGVAVDVRRDPDGLLVLLREATETSPQAEAVVSRVPPVAEPRPLSEPSPSTAELARSLFPPEDEAAAVGGTEGQPSVSELYPQLFPGGPPQTAPETAEPTGAPTAAGAGIAVGPFRVRAGVDARYVDADTFIEGPENRMRAHYLEVGPRVAAEAPLSDGRFSLQYRPSLRALSSVDEVNTNSHRAMAGIDLPLGPSLVARVQDTFVSGVLDTRDADPGGEYFFDLGHFRRNTIEGGLSVLLAPRLSLELAAATSTLRFQEESSFFDYDSRRASAGLGYELTPTLKTTLMYSYDTVPAPGERPLVASRSHNAQLTLTGDVLPLVSGRLTLGYRDQRSPSAGPGGTRYTGLTMGGSLTKQFSHESDATLFVNRSTPVSAFEDNAFYVFTGVQASGRLRLPLELQLRGGVGYQWNDYRTVAEGADEPRSDRILGFHLGLRRALVRQLSLSVIYRREERRSNLERFTANSDGFFVQLEWDIIGNAP